MKLLEFTMTGTAHSAAYKEQRHAIMATDALELVPDTGNAYDADAVKVLWNGHHIGWVPKKLGEAKSMLVRLLKACESGDLYCAVDCEVETHSPDNPTDMQLICTVSLLSFEE